MSDTRAVFLSRLQEARSAPATVGFDDGFHKGYNLRRERYGWSVFVRGRGVEDEAVGSPPRRTRRPTSTSGSYPDERLTLTHRADQAP